MSVNVYIILLKKYEKELVNKERIEIYCDRHFQYHVRH